METFTPIELLKNKLAELKSGSGLKPNLIIEYEKAILALEFIGGVALVEMVTEPIVLNFNKEPKKEPISYFEKFMVTQRNKNSKSR